MRGFLRFGEGLRWVNGNRPRPVRERLNKYKYEVISKASEYHGNVDVIYSSEDLVLRRGHIYHVRVNTNQDAPRVLKCFREVT